MKQETSDWYRGTADAVYQNFDFVDDDEYERVLILAGDHVYLMDYNELVDFHVRNEADVTVGVYEVPLAEASRYGVLTADESGRIVAFDEKPKQPKKPTPKA